MRILIVKLTSMGDVLFSLPVAADLKRAYPNATIDWVVDSRFADLPRACRLIDHVHALPFRDFGWANAAGALGKILRTLRDIRARRYDIAVDLQGMTKSAAIVRLSGAKTRWGYRAGDMAEPLLSGVFTHRFETGRGPHPVVRYRQEIAQVSATETDGAPDFAWAFQSGQANSPSAQASTGIATAVMFPFASKENKQIPDDFVSSIICELKAKGFHVAIPSGSPKEQALADRWCEQPGVTRWPQQPLGQLMPALSKAACFVGADTGLTHLAAALGVKTLAVFAKTRPQRYGPHLWSEHARSVSVHDATAKQQLGAFMEWVKP